MTLYHYTSLYHLPTIQADGMLKLTESNIDRLIQHAGPPVVWLTDLAELGEASHGLEGSRFDKKQVRIEVRVPAIRWLDWEYTQPRMPGRPGMDPEWRTDLIDMGGGMAAAEHWYIWPAPIRANRWGEIHTFPYRPDRLVRMLGPGGGWKLAADLDKEEGYDWTEAGADGHGDGEGAGRLGV